jgi:selT/selW/selH-like putative selenoprotein
LREDLFLFGSAELIPSDRGAFEVFKDGELLFSKLELDRFPNDGEITNLIQGI